MRPLVAPLVLASILVGACGERGAAPPETLDPYATDAADVARVLAESGLPLTHPVRPTIAAPGRRSGAVTATDSADLDISVYVHPDSLEAAESRKRTAVGDLGRTVTCGPIAVWVVDVNAPGGVQPHVIRIATQVESILGTRFGPCP